MYGTGPFEDINVALPPVPGAKPTPRLDRFFIILTVVISIVILGIVWYLEAF